MTDLPAALLALQARIDRLEVRNGRLRWSAAALAVLVAALCFKSVYHWQVSREIPDVVTAKRFVLVDSGGKSERGVWEDKAGVTSISFKEGNFIRSQWLVDKDQSILALNSPSSYPGIWLVAGNQSGASLHMLGSVGALPQSVGDPDLIKEAQKEGVTTWAHLSAGADGRLIVASDPARRVDLWSGRGNVEAPALTLQTNDKNVPVNNRSLFLGQKPGSPYRLTFYENINQPVYQIPPP